MKYLVANWKANKNLNEAIAWIKTFNKLLENDKRTQDKLQNNELKVIICPSHHLLYPVREKLINVPNVTLGAQDVSFFEKGSYTGEVPASTLSNLVDFAIVGHSERRKYFKETNATIDQKIRLAKQYNIEPILCVRDKKDLVYDVRIVSYEPVYAIGSGDNEQVDKVLQMKQNLDLGSNVKFLYGGSANEENAASYIETGQIDGFLIGTASKDPISFYNTVTASL